MNQWIIRVAGTATSNIMEDWLSTTMSNLPPKDIWRWQCLSTEEAVSKEVASQWINCGCFHLLPITPGLKVWGLTDPTLSTLHCTEKYYLWDLSLAPLEISETGCTSLFRFPSPSLSCSLLLFLCSTWLLSLTQAVTITESTPHFARSKMPPLTF